LPRHFHTLLRAAVDGNLALMERTDAATGELRYVICAVGRDGTDFLFTPFGHLADGNPFEAYLPPLSSTLPLLEMLNIRFGCGVNYHFCPPGTERDPSHPFTPCRTTTPAK
jgi:hypothetical protein